MKLCHCDDERNHSGGKGFITVGCRSFSVLQRQGRRDYLRRQMLFRLRVYDRIIFITLCYYELFRKGKRIAAFESLFYAFHHSSNNKKIMIFTPTIFHTDKKI